MTDRDVLDRCEPCINKCVNLKSVAKPDHVRIVEDLAGVTADHAIDVTFVLAAHHPGVYLNCVDRLTVARTRRINEEFGGADDD